MKQLENTILRRINFPITAAIGIVVCLSVLMFIIVQNRESHLIQADFKQTAMNGVNSIKREINIHIDALRPVHRLFKAPHNITRKEFHSFCGTYLSSYRGIQAIVWVPRVSNSLRDAYENDAQINGHPAFQITKFDTNGQTARADKSKEYFPVYYAVYGSGADKSNEFTLGLDLASAPSLLEAMNKTRGSGEMAAVAETPQERQNNRQPVLSVFLPVYYNQAPIETSKERHENLIGFVLGVFRIDKLLEEALSYLNESNVSFGLYDITGNQNRQFLAANLMQTGGEGGQSVDLQDAGKESLRILPYLQRSGQGVGITIQTCPGIH